MGDPVVPPAAVTLGEGGARREAAVSSGASGAASSDAGHAASGAANMAVSDRAEASAGDGRVASARAADSTREALRATAGWAVPLQWVAILGSGGIAVFLALTHRWRSYDWLFVLLCALYVANAVGFRRLSKRDVR